MGFFSFLSGDKIENENRSKPFHKNSSNSERKDWFARTRPWHKVDPRIIDALIAKYNDNPMFEVFVVTSMEKSLVGEYEEIGRKGIDPIVACSVISGILFRHGASAAAQVMKMFKSGNQDKNKFSKFYSEALDMLESSTIIDTNQVGAYVQLASLKALLSKNDEALSFVRQGLATIQRIRESNIPFHKSNIPSIQNATQHLDDVEKSLLALREELS